MLEDQIEGAVFIGLSLDGQIARANGDIDWLTGDAPDGEEPPADTGYDEFFASVDAMAMGSNTYETVLGFDAPWYYKDKPVLVLSRTLDSSPIETVSFHRSVDELVAAARERGLRRLYVDGGETIQEFLRRGLISEITLTFLPVLIGRGIPLFGELDRDIHLDLVSARQLSKGMVQLKYQSP